jgi:hypothetical protein
MATTARRSTGVAVWEDPDTIPRDGSPVLVLKANALVEACRYGVLDEGEADEIGGWFELDWRDLCFYDEQPEDAEYPSSPVVGWLPFPAFSDPFVFMAKPTKKEA